MKFSTIVLALAFVASGASAGFAAAKPDALKYSYKFWGRGEIRSGQNVSAHTPFGTLSCNGGSNYTQSGQQKSGSPRHCHW